MPKRNSYFSWEQDLALLSLTEELTALCGGLMRSVANGVGPETSACSVLVAHSQFSRRMRLACCGSSASPRCLPPHHWLDRASCLLFASGLIHSWGFDSKLEVPFMGLLFLSSCRMLLYADSREMANLLNVLNRKLYLEHGLFSVRLTFRDACADAELQCRLTDVELKNLNAQHRPSKSWKYFGRSTATWDQFKQLLSQFMSRLRNRHLATSETMFGRFPAVFARTECQRLISERQCKGAASIFWAGTLRHVDLMVAKAACANTAQPALSCRRPHIPC